MVVGKAHEELDEAWFDQRASSDDADWDEAPGTGLPKDWREWQLIALVLVLIFLTGIALLVAVQLH